MTSLNKDCPVQSQCLETWWCHHHRDWCTEYCKWFCVHLCCTQGEYALIDKLDGLTGLMVPSSCVSVAPWQERHQNPIWTQLMLRWCADCFAWNSTCCSIPVQGRKMGSCKGRLHRPQHGPQQDTHLWCVGAKPWRKAWSLFLHSSELWTSTVFKLMI